MDILQLLGLRHPAAQPPAQSPSYRPIPAPGDESPLPASPEVQAQIDQANQPPITITGDNFKPRKPSLLAILGDAMLVHGGYKPQFSQNRRDEDYRRAMEGYSDDPLGTIKKLGRLKGREHEAEVLYNQYVDNKRADVAADAIAEERKQKGRNVLSAMLGSVTDENTYNRMLPTLKKYAETRGIDPSELPDTYDPDQIKMYRMGGMTVDQQEDNARQDQSVNSQVDYRQRRLSQYQQALGLQSQNVHSEIANRVTRTQEYLRRGQQPSAAHDPAKLRANKVVRDKNGLVQFDKTGNKMKITDKNGKQWGYGIDPHGKAVFIGPIDPATGNIVGAK